MPKVIHGCKATQVQIDKMKRIARAHKTQTAAMQNAKDLKSEINAPTKDESSVIVMDKLGLESSR